MNTITTDTIDRYGDREIDLAAFELDATIADRAQRFSLSDSVHAPFFFSPFAELTPSQLKAAAHTSVDLIQPSVVITNTTGAPFAAFDMTDTPARRPAVSVHFVPSDYGFTNTATYAVTFYVDTTAGVRLQTGNSYGVTVNRPDSDSRTGAHAITFTFVDLPPSQPMYADISQSQGGQWAWYRTSIGHPPLVFEP